MIRRSVLLFPGQASQYVGMGRLAAERFPQAREIFSRVDAALGQPISEICFQGPAEKLQDTRWQQPAVFACSLAIYQAWRAVDGATDSILGAAGHSLGEYSALVAAGALSLEDAATLVALRGRVMQEAAECAPGGMIAILGLDRGAVEAICAAVSREAKRPEELVVAANDNAPGQQVISGGVAALERAAILAKTQGAKRVLPLKVAGAFHSPLMASATEALAAAVSQTTFHPCAFPVISNSSCEWLIEPAEMRAELVRQLTAPVRWVENVEALASLEPDLWVDTGPGTVVAGLVGRILSAPPTLNLATLIDAPVQKSVVE